MLGGDKLALSGRGEGWSVNSINSMDVEIVLLILNPIASSIVMYLHEPILFHHILKLENRSN